MPVYRVLNATFFALASLHKLGSWFSFVKFVGATPCGRPKDRAGTGACPYIRYVVKMKLNHDLNARGMLAQ